MFNTSNRQLPIFLSSLALLSINFASSFSAQAQTPATATPYPTKPIKLIAPVAAGGGLDNLARKVADRLSKNLGQTIIIENMGGGGGTIASQYVAKAAPDGYTLLASYVATHGTNPAVRKLPYDAIKDFTAIGMIGATPNVLVINPDVPAKNLKEFVAYAKKNPGKLNYASQGNGSVSHIGTEMFKQTTGIDMVHVPYKGSGPAIQDVLAGQVQVFISTPPSLMQHVQSGKLKGLAVTGKNRHPGMPNVPTTAEAGLPSFQLESWVGLFAPAGPPACLPDEPRGLPARERQRSRSGRRAVQRERSAAAIPGIPHHC